MNCPVCGETTFVVRSIADCEAVYRRRKCRECNYTFYSTEYESDSSVFYKLEYQINKKYQRRRGDDGQAKN